MSEHSICSACGLEAKGEGMCAKCEALAEGVLCRECNRETHDESGLCEVCADTQRIEIMPPAKTASARIAADCDRALDIIRGAR